jgi:hypothetical protein
VVLEGYRQAVATARLVDVPLTAVTVAGGLAAELDPGSFECPLIVIRRIVLPPFAQDLERRTTGPLFVVN